MNGRKKAGDVSLSPEQRDFSRAAQSKPKINRLRRSPRPSQPQPRSQELLNTVPVPDFKTPTRLPKGRFRSVKTEESPNNDAEFQHDIIWDPNSPATPSRNGRGRRKAANVKLADISEIVNRIAPKSRRPEEAEASLLQWIGDSAIPCTPEIREPKPKPKSTRPNVVDDLLKLAQQFDFNMIRQDEAKQQSSEQTMDEDQDLFYDEGHPPSPPQNEPEAERALQGAEQAKTPGEEAEEDPMDDDDALVQAMDDDLDLLFDGSTQKISGRLSQGWSGWTQEVAKSTQSVTVSGNGRMVGGPTNVTFSSSNNRQHSGLSTAGVADAPKPNVSSLDNCGKVSNANDFQDDDWSNDDLLEDSLMFEMTQNPQLFSAPQHSSTQKLGWTTNKTEVAISTNRTKDTGSTNSETVVSHQKPISEVTYGASQGQNQKIKGRQTFQMDLNPVGHHWDHQTPGTLPSNRNVPSKNNQQRQQQQVLGSIKAPSLVPLPNNLNSDKWPKPQVPDKVQKPSGSSPMVSNTSLRTPSYTKVTEVTSKVIEANQKQPTADDHGLSDIAAEDLDSIFASDDIWDDDADDDDLFCEACEDVDEFTSTSKPVPPVPTSVAKLPAPKNGSIQSRTFGFGSSLDKVQNTTANMSPKLDNVFVQPCPPNKWVNNSSNSISISNSSRNAASFSTEAPLPTQNSQNSSVTFSKGPYKFTHITKSSTSGPGRGVINGGPQQQVGARPPTASSNQMAERVPDDHRFKKPDSTFSSSTSAVQKGPDISMSVVSKCSDAEIERKRQQAMERRRLRITASQNLRAPV